MLSASTWSSGGVSDSGWWVPTGRARRPCRAAGRAAAADGRRRSRRGRRSWSGYYDQRRPTSTADATVRDLVAGPHRPPGSPGDIKLMKRFLFTGDLPFARVGTLSGGERRRLQMLLRHRRPAQRPVPGRTHQRPRPGHALRSWRTF